VVPHPFLQKRMRERLTGRREIVNYMHKDKACDLQKYGVTRGKKRDTE